MRQLRALGRSTARLVRHADMAYRKPFFAGDEASVSLSLWEAGEHLVATGTFAPPGVAGAAVRPSVYVRLVL